MAKYFKNPFAIGGDRTTIPEPEQGDGSVSYVEGFGPDYSRNLRTDPDAKAVPRAQTNELFYETQLAVQQYQQHGVPDFITSIANGGAPYSYNRYDRVRYDDGINGIRIFMSLEDLNTNTPSLTDPKWLWIDNNIEQILGVSHSVFAPAVQNGDAVYWDALNNRYDQAIADGTGKEQVIGFAFTTINFVLNAGTTGYPPGGLSPGATYFLSNTTPGAIVNAAPPSDIVRIGVALTATELYIDIVNAQDALAGALPVAATIDVAQGTAVPPGFIECDGSPVSRTTYARLFGTIGTIWGNGDGSTTFNVPDLRRRTTIGRGGTGTGVIGNAVGDTGGEEAHVQTLAELASHGHATNATVVEDFAPTTGFEILAVTPSGSITWAPATVDPEGSSSPMNVMQPSAVMLKCIKY